MSDLAIPPVPGSPAAFEQSQENAPLAPAPLALSVDTSALASLSLADEGKSILKSKTMIGLAITLLGAVMPAILQATHVHGLQASDVMDLIQQALTFGGMAFAAYGRIVAKNRIA